MTVMTPITSDYRSGERPTEHDTRVVLADHDPISRYVLGNMLKKAKQINLVAGVDTHQPWRNWPLDRADVVVLGSAIPDNDLFPLIQELTAHRIRVLILCADCTREKLDAAFSSGVGGYIRKDAQIGSIASAVHAVAADHRVLSPELLALYRAPSPAKPAPALTLAFPVGAQSSDKLLRSLTSRESRVLALLAEGKSTAEVAGDLRVSPATVKSHISHALTKLGVRNRLEAVLMAQQVLERGGELVGARS
jgi:two-component system nitrate/nitrite response regulator NarL